MDKRTFELKLPSLFAGLVILSLCWSIFSLFQPTSQLPSLEADYRMDIVALPDFSAFTNTKKKKQAFFDFLYPVIEKENKFLLQIREQILAFNEALKIRTLNDEELNWLNTLSQDYLIEPGEPQEMIDQLLLSIQSIPPSMVLAQAAIESGWGTSRFARKGNNLFGHWCFEAGCGLVPKKRDDDKSHEVAKFKSVNESIRAYLKNLNSFHRYEDFRDLRQTHLKEDSWDVNKMLPGLLAYSELGPLYIKKVSRMIKQNNLGRFDQRFYEQTDAI